MPRRAEHLGRRPGLYDDAAVLKTPTYRSFARRLHNRYRTATPDTTFRHFIAAPGDLHHTRRRRGPPAPGRPHALLLDAGYHDRRPWCDGRRLSYSFERA